MLDNLTNQYSVNKLFHDFHSSTVSFQGCYLTKIKYYIKTFIAVQQACAEGQFSELVTEEYFKRNTNIFCRINSLKIPIKMFELSISKNILIFKK